MGHQFRFPDRAFEVSNPLGHLVSPEVPEGERRPCAQRRVGAAPVLRKLQEVCIPRVQWTRDLAEELSAESRGSMSIWAGRSLSWYLA